MILIHMATTLYSRLPKVETLIRNGVHRWDSRSYPESLVCPCSLVMFPLSKNAAISSVRTAVSPHPLEPITTALSLLSTKFSPRLDLKRSQPVFRYEPPRSARPIRLRLSAVRPRSQRLSLRNLSSHSKPASMERFNAEVVTGQQRSWVLFSGKTCANNLKLSRWRNLSPPE